MIFGDNTHAAPAAWSAIQARTAALGFDMPSEANTGALLRLLAASKPGGRMLELGTGTGLATAWLLDGLGAGASLVSVDVDPVLQDVAREHLKDQRLRFVLADGVDYVRGQPPGSLDLIFADAWPGKYEALDETLALLSGEVCMWSTTCCSNPTGRKATKRGSTI
ncbi:methyltransferase domain-containing protein [Caulobacter sp. 1776]|uniref:O-methyltransferase n=1 Tax=Caulobacter sp. 1776 TaxID=3156420 RepID=UPI003391D863